MALNTTAIKAMTILVTNAREPGKVNDANSFKFNTFHDVTFDLVFFKERA